MNVRRLFMSLVLLIFCGASAFAQKTITGTVTDSASGRPLQSVSVLVQGTKVGAQTNADGKFTLNAPANATTLVVSSVGYGTKNVDISSENISIFLAPASSTLNDIVVIGYGTTRKKDLTGSIATVNEKDFQKGVISTPEQLIAGKVAGVSIISNSGQPGSGSTIRIRGGSSLNASNDPLIVIDGVPLSNDAISGASNPLSFINANDIESFTILKDASAAAIYGTRASNGVIIITTKKGISGGLKLDFNSVNSLSDVTKEVSVLNAEQFKSLVNEYGDAAHIAALGSANTDWQKQIYHEAFSSDNNISFSGGIKGLPYRVSIGYLNQDGILKTDNLAKTSAALVLNPVLFDNHLKINLNLKGSQEKFRFANTGAIGSAISFDPTQPVYSGDKLFGGYTIGGYSTLGDVIANPVAALDQYHNNSTAYRSIGNLQLDYKFHFLPDLHANLNLGYDVSKGSGTIFIPDSSSVSFNTARAATHQNGENNIYKQNSTNTLLEFYFNYVKSFGKSTLDATAGYSYNNYITKSFNFYSFYANNDTVPNSKPTYPFDKPQHTLLSYFGRINFTYNSRYLLTLTVRDDNSSRFSKDNRSAIFPSAAFAWNMKEEGFLKPSNVVSQLKLRLGYGITGQQDGIDNYGSFTSYYKSGPNAQYYFGDSSYYGVRPTAYYSKLKWEQTSTANVGIDYGFFNNRISGSVDLYYRKTSDLLVSTPQAAGTNYSAYVLTNVGDMENKGVEFTLNFVPVKTATVEWDAAFNITYNKNKITALIGGNNPSYIGFPTGQINGSQGFAFLNAVGGPKSSFYLYHQIYDSSGHPVEGLFEDVNRDGIINEDDKYKSKQADPNVFLGFSSNVTFGKWNAGVVLRASFNNYIYNNVYSNYGRLTSVTSSSVTKAGGSPAMFNASTNVLDTRFQGNTDQQPLSDYYLENGSFLKMDNAYIGYNFGKVFNNKSSLQLNINVQNVFTITKYNGLDPEIVGGVDYNFYPRPRIYSLGLNLNF